MTNKVKIITLLGFQYSRWKQQSHGLILLDAIESPSSIYFPWASNSMWSVYGLISSPSTSILICDDQNTLKACRLSFARERKCGWFVAWTPSNPLGKSGFVIIMQYCVRVHIVTYLSLSFDLIWFDSQALNILAADWWLPFMCTCALRVKLGISTGMQARWNAKHPCCNLAKAVEVSLNSFIFTMKTLSSNWLPINLSY